MKVLLDHFDSLKSGNTEWKECFDDILKKWRNDHIADNSDTVSEKSQVLPQNWQDTKEQMLSNFVTKEHDLEKFQQNDEKIYDEDLSFCSSK